MATKSTTDKPLPRKEDRTAFTVDTTKAKTSAAIKTAVAKLDKKVARYPRKARSTGVTVVLVNNADKAALPNAPAGWLTVCTEHGTACPQASLRAADYFQSRPELWCKPCSEMPKPEPKAKAKPAGKKATASKARSTAKKSGKGKATPKPSNSPEAATDATPGPNDGSHPDRAYDEVRTDAYTAPINPIG